MHIYNNRGPFGRISCFSGHKVLKRSTEATKKLKPLNNVLGEKELSSILWWKEVCSFTFFLKLLDKLCIFVRVISFIFLFFLLQRLQTCKKPSTVQLVKRLEYSNLLGLDVNLKNGR